MDSNAEEWRIMNTKINNYQSGQLISVTPIYSGPCFSKYCIILKITVPLTFSFHCAFDVGTSNH